MIRNQIFFIPLVVASLAVVAQAAPPTVSSSTPASIESRPKPANHGFGLHLEAILQCVHATPEQRAKITAIVNEFKPKIEPLRNQYREKRDQFLAAMTSRKSDEEIMLKQNEVGQLFSNITNEYCVLHLKVRKCLKPEQITAYEQYRRSQGWVRGNTAEGSGSN